MHLPILQNFVQLTDDQKQIILCFFGGENVVLRSAHVAAYWNFISLAFIIFIVNIHSVITRYF
jgi:hypothetical protein